MTFALKTENGVSSCGGLLVRPIIGRFCGYLTSGRSPFSNGRVAVAANARKEETVIPEPSAAMAAPERFMRLRRSIMVFLSFNWSMYPARRSSAASLPASSRSRKPAAADTCVQAKDQAEGDTLRRDILASLTCGLFRLRLD